MTATASTVEPTTTTAEVRAASTAVEAVRGTGVAVERFATAYVCVCATVVIGTAVAAATAVVSTVAVVAATAVAPTVKPRSCADENSADEVARAIVSVRSACIWRIGVIAIRASRSGTVIATHRTDAYSYRPLRIRMGNNEKTQTKTNTNKS